MTDQQDEIQRQIGFARMFMRKERPLPKPGCSWAFYIFLLLLAVGLIIMYIIYRKG